VEEVEVTLVILSLNHLVVVLQQNALIKPNNLVLLS